MIDEVVGLEVPEPCVHMANEVASYGGFEAGQPSACYAERCVLGYERFQARPV